MTDIYTSSASTNGFKSMWSLDATIPYQNGNEINNFNQNNLSYSNTLDSSHFSNPNIGAIFAQQLSTISTNYSNFNPNSSLSSSAGSPSSYASTSPPSTDSLKPILPTHQRKKKPQPVPDDQKDSAYFERRKKNNESARRSREQRKLKEESSQQKICILQAENHRLKYELAASTSQIAALTNELNQLKNNLGLQAAAAAAQTLGQPFMMSN
uniref:Protein giant (inferred by orthology to a D. melanogaster protein) n=1 Tax=Strongyloides venezuelensis TaxID=75913 RepID=A0A0K0F918_STRVS